MTRWVVKDHATGRFSVGVKECDFSRVHRKGLIGLGAAAGLAAILLLCLAERSEAAFQSGADNGPIVFQSNRDGDWEIYTMNSNGSDETRLTNNKVYDGQPTFNDTGDKIAFVSTRGGRQQIWTMNSDGSGEPQLFVSRRHASHPSFSGQPPSVEGTGDELVFEAPYAAAPCGPSQQIFYATDDGPPTEGKRLTDTCTDNKFPTFSPNGDQVLYLAHSWAERQPTVISYHFGRPPGLSFEHKRALLCDWPCAWGFSVGPYGEQAAYSVGQEGFEKKIYYSDPAGDVTGDAYWSKVQPLVPKGSGLLGQQNDTQPSFAPEGNWIAVERDHQDILRLSFPPSSRGFDRLTKKGQNWNPDWGGA
jgi:hypothetical protein